MKKRGQNSCPSKYKYICCFPDADGRLRRVNSEASTTKLEYIFEVLNSLGIDFEIISPSHLMDRGISKGGIRTIDGYKIRFFTAFSVHGLSRLSLALERLEFCRWFLKNVKEGDTVIVYHSLAYAELFLKLKKLRNFRLISEVEEIYQDVKQFPANVCKTELDYLKILDGILTPSATLNEKINPDGKPCVIIHGLYKLQDIKYSKFSDGKIHLLYSGIIDEYKGGAAGALGMAGYLPENYVVHITGFGSDQQINAIQQKCETLKTKAEIIFHGFISRDELQELMQRCHIGLCTQDPSTQLNLTSFPSKILNYMSNGLPVFTGRSKSIEDSYVSDVVYFYDKQDYKAMAETLMDMPLSDGSRERQRIIELDQRFKTEVKDLLDSNTKL